MNYSDQQYAAAREAFSSGEYKEALDLVTNSITVLRKSVILRKQRDGEDFIRYIDAKMLQGRIHAQLNEDDQVTQVLDHVKELSIGSGSKTDAFLQGKINYFFFDLELSKGNEEDAFSYLDKSKDYFIQAENYQSAIDIIFDLQRFSDRYPDQDSYLELYKEARKLSDKLNKEKKLENSGKARLQTAKVLLRTDYKNAKKNTVLASKDLEKNPQLYHQSQLQLIEFQIRNDPKKSRNLCEDVRKESEDQQFVLPARLFEFACDLIQDKDVDNKKLESTIKEVEKLPQNVETADFLLENLRLLLLYGKINSDSLQILADYCQNAYSKVDDKRGITAVFLLNAVISGDIENKLKLVKIYSKSHDTDRIDHLRPTTLDLIKWVFHEDEKQVVEDVKRFYDDRIYQAESLYLLSKLKTNGVSEELEKNAKKLYSGTKLKSHQNIKS